MVRNEKEQVPNDTRLELGCYDEHFRQSLAHLPRLTFLEAVFLEMPFLTVRFTTGFLMVFFVDFDLVDSVPTADPLGLAPRKIWSQPSENFIDDPV